MLRFHEACPCGFCKGEFGGNLFFQFGNGACRWQAEQSGTSWKVKLKNAIDEAIEIADTYEDCLNLIRSKGYEIKGESLDKNAPKYISFRPLDREHFIRGSECGFCKGEFGGNLFFQFGNGACRTVTAGGNFEAHKKSVSDRNYITFFRYTNIWFSLYPKKSRIICIHLPH